MALCIRCCRLVSPIVFRWMSSHQPDLVNPPGKFKKRLVNAYMKFVEKQENLLERRFPKAFKVYNVFKIGIKDFIKDLRIYYNVSLDVWADKSLTSFTRHELETYRQMPYDMLVVGPVLLISLLPFANYIIFPLAYIFPKYLLSRQFWSAEQRRMFWKERHKHCVEHFPSVLNILHSRIKHVSDPQLKENLVTILKKLDNTLHVHVDEILAIQPLFKTGLFHQDKLSWPHVRHLGKGLRLSTNRSKLQDDGLLLHYTDAAMAKEGIHKLTNPELEMACFWRGLNPVGLRRHEIIDYLTKWTEISQSIDETSISLLLHCPVFLAYNHPTNRELLGRRFKWRRRDFSS